MAGPSNNSREQNASSGFSIEEDPFFAQDLQQLAKAVNYRQWQFRIIAPYIKGNVLEIGGGIGNFTADLARCSDSVISIEPNAFCYGKLVEKTKPLTNVTVYNVPAESLDRHVRPDYLADTVACMNVLEHLQDDEAAVGLFTRRLKSGGTLVLLVPAVPWAFGEIDKRLGHYRRYSKKSALALIRKANLSLVDMRYFNFIGVWGWFWNARVARIKTQNDSQIRIFDRYIVPWQSWLEGILPPFIGQSLLVVARKN
jgi:2-polyprenyl-3-methyl-5-hydroxy-6-metoxy-1,4-benzoquinol methylase